MRISNSVRRSYKAFTLVELLVVIGIIALLISVLLPALSSARRQANTVKCASNLHQVGLGLLMYAQAYDGHLPGSYMNPQPYTLVDVGIPSGSITGTEVYWWQALQIQKLLPGVGSPGASPFVCPSTSGNYQPFDADGSNPTYAGICNCNYAINDYMTIECAGTANVLPLNDSLVPVGTGNPVRMTAWPKVLAVGNATDKILVTEILTGYVIDWYAPNTIPNLSVSGPPYYNQIDWRRHVGTTAKAGLANVLYLDGHVAPAKQNANGGSGHDQANVVNDINGSDYTLGASVIAKMTEQSQPY